MHYHQMLFWAVIKRFIGEPAFRRYLHALPGLRGLDVSGELTPEQKEKVLFRLRHDVFRNSEITSNIGGRFQRTLDLAISSGAPNTGVEEPGHVFASTVYLEIRSAVMRAYWDTNGAMDDRAEELFPMARAVIDNYRAPWSEFRLGHDIRPEVFDMAMGLYRSMAGEDHTAAEFKQRHFSDEAERLQIAEEICAIFDGSRPANDEAVLDALGRIYNTFRDALPSEVRAAPFAEMRSMAEWSEAICEVYWRDDFSNWFERQLNGVDAVPWNDYHVGEAHRARVLQTLVRERVPGTYPVIQGEVYPERYRLNLDIDAERYRRLIREGYITLPKPPEFSPHARDVFDVLDSTQGIVLGEDHYEFGAKQLLVEQAEALRQAGVEVLFMEHFLADFHQEALDRLVHTGEVDDFLVDYVQPFTDRLSLGENAALERFNYLEVAKAAGKAGIKIVALDCFASYWLESSEHAWEGGRLQAMNYYAARRIETYLAAHGNGKWIAFVGNAHANDVIGMHGLASLCGATSIRAIDGVSHRLEADTGTRVNRDGTLANPEFDFDRGWVSIADYTLSLDVRHDDVQVFEVGDSHFFLRQTSWLKNCKRPDLQRRILISMEEGRLRNEWSIIRAYPDGRTFRTASSTYQTEMAKKAGEGWKFYCTFDKHNPKVGKAFVEKFIMKIWRKSCYGFLQDYASGFRLSIQSDAGSATSELPLFDASLIRAFNVRDERRLGSRVSDSSTSQDVAMEMEQVRMEERLSFGRPWTTKEMAARNIVAKAFESVCRGERAPGASAQTRAVSEELLSAHIRQLTPTAEIARQYRKSPQFAALSSALEDFRVAHRVPDTYVYAGMEILRRNGSARITFLHQDAFAEDVQGHVQLAGEPDASRKLVFDADQTDAFVSIEAARQRRFANTFVYDTESETVRFRPTTLASIQTLSEADGTSVSSSSAGSQVNHSITALGVLMSIKNLLDGTRHLIERGDPLTKSDWMLLAQPLYGVVQMPLHFALANAPRILTRSLPGIMARYTELSPLPGRVYQSGLTMGFALLNVYFDAANLHSALGQLEQAEQDGIPQLVHLAWARVILAGTQLTLSSGIALLDFSALFVESAAEAASAAMPYLAPLFGVLMIGGTILDAMALEAQAEITAERNFRRAVAPFSAIRNSFLSSDGKSIKGLQTLPEGKQNYVDERAVVEEIDLVRNTLTYGSLRLHKVDHARAKTTGTYQGMSSHHRGIPTYADTNLFMGEETFNIYERLAQNALADTTRTVAIAHPLASVHPESKTATLLLPYAVGGTYRYQFAAPSSNPGDLAEKDYAAGAREIVGDFASDAVFCLGYIQLEWLFKSEHEVNYLDNLQFSPETTTCRVNLDGSDISLVLQDPAKRYLDGMSAHLDEETKKAERLLHEQSDKLRELERLRDNAPNFIERIVLDEKCASAADEKRRRDSAWSDLEASKKDKSHLQHAASIAATQSSMMCYVLNGGGGNYVLGLGCESVSRIDVKTTPQDTWTVDLSRIWGLVQDGTREGAVIDIHGGTLKFEHPAGDYLAGSLQTQTICFDPMPRPLNLQISLSDSHPYTNGVRLMYSSAVHVNQDGSTASADAEAMLSVSISLHDDVVSKFLKQESFRRKVLQWLDDLLSKIGIQRPGKCTYTFSGKVPEQPYPSGDYSRPRSSMFRCIGNSLAKASFPTLELIGDGGLFLSTAMALESKWLFDAGEGTQCFEVLCISAQLNDSPHLRMAAQMREATKLQSVILICEEDWKDSLAGKLEARLSTLPYDIYDLPVHIKGNNFSGLFFTRSEVRVLIDRRDETTDVLILDRGVVRERENVLGGVSHWLSHDKVAMSASQSAALSFGVRYTYDLAAGISDANCVDCTLEYPYDDAMSVIRAGVFDVETLTSSLPLSRLLMTVMLSEKPLTLKTADGSGLPVLEISLRHEGSYGFKMRSYIETLPEKKTRYYYTAGASPSMLVRSSDSEAVVFVQPTDHGYRPNPASEATTEMIQKVRKLSIVAEIPEAISDSMIESEVSSIDTTDFETMTVVLPPQPRLGAVREIVVSGSLAKSLPNIVLGQKKGLDGWKVSLDGPDLLLIFDSEDFRVRYLDVVGTPLMTEASFSIPFEGVYKIETLGSLLKNLPYLSLEIALGRDDHDICYHYSNESGWSCQWYYSKQRTTIPINEAPAREQPLIAEGKLVGRSGLVYAWRDRAVHLLGVLRGDKIVPLAYRTRFEPTMH